MKIQIFLDNTLLCSYIENMNIMAAATNKKIQVTCSCLLIGSVDDDDSGGGVGMKALVADDCWAKCLMMVCLCV